MDTEITVTASGLALSGPILAGERVAVSVSGVPFAEGAKPTLVLLSRFPDALLASVELAEGEEGEWAGVLDTATRQVGAFFATARADERRDAVLELIDANGETRDSVARLLVPFGNSALCPSPMHAQPAASVYVAGPKGDKGDPGTSIPLPVSVANGGTGATTAAAARANLGAVNRTGDTMTGRLTATSFTAEGSGSSFVVNPAPGVFTTFEHPGVLTVTETSGGATSVAFVPGTTPASANPGKTIVLGESLPASETWTFVVDDGQGGTTTITKQVAVYAAAQTQGAGA